MRDDFCAFILTHGRPDRVYTYNTLIRSGYTGKVFIVIDDEDKTAAEYKKRFGDKVLQFCKSDMDVSIDTGDNFLGRTSTIWPRNAFWALAERVGCRYFIQLDDDYTAFKFRFTSDGRYKYTSWKLSCDGVFTALVEFLNKTNALSIAMSQGGDFIGGGSGGLKLMRKAMNSFVCDTKKPFYFIGRMNEDVNTYVTMGLRGYLFFTTSQVQLDQKQTQTNSGGMSELYLDSGTYIKSFHTVMRAPSCVKIGQLVDPRSKQFRIHHKINWNNTAPKILSDIHKKNKIKDATGGEPRVLA